jgi:hypothetical protein
MLCRDEADVRQKASELCLHSVLALQQSANEWNCSRKVVLIARKQCRGLRLVPSGSKQSSARPKIGAGHRRTEVGIDRMEDVAKAFA